MKKAIMMLLLGAAVTTGANAQTKEVKQHENGLKQNIEAKKKVKHEAGKDLAHLRVKSALKKRKQVRHHRKTIHRQANRLKREGVNHPIKQAKVEAKLDKTKKNQ